MKNERYIHTPLIIALVLLLGTVGFMWKFAPDSAVTTMSNENEDKNAVSTAAKSTNNQSSSSDSGKKSESGQKKEMLAVWVPYMSLSVADDPGEENFKNKFDNIVSTAKKHNINALIVHIRPCGDSMFLSDYFPYSHILTGKQGKDPGYDAMKYMIESTHNAGMEFHAWVNPLRIKINDTPPTLSEYSPYSIWQNDDDESNDRYTMEYDGGIYLNPAYPEVREYIIGSIKEIASRYDVDGIQFDDYFYPDSSEDYDQAEYESYIESLDGADAMSHLNWRTSNINSLISGVYSAIKSVKSDIVFGISPQGNIDNDIEMGADVYSWGSIEGYCDYLCPQNYFSQKHNTLPFNTAVDNWRKLVSCEKVKLYIGLGLYKAGSDADDGTWLDSDENIKSQIEYGRSKGADGFMLYSFDYLENEQTQAEVKNAMNYLSS